ncbi:hypothetical protein DL98DRAFT_652547 [Cadophora sp. DSE1049]|nr:hypothetical protein DL98DRAFT_652547 [Cadophora sp. DSE1049]
MESVEYKRLDIAKLFEPLSENEKLYTYHMSRAAWLGTRIIFRQVSAEANDIFDLLVELYRMCSGEWQKLIEDIQHDEVQKQLDGFLQYAALFLNNMGNYYGQGDQKIVPACDRTFLEKLVAKSNKAQGIAKSCLDRMLSPEPGHLGLSCALREV